MLSEFFLRYLWKVFKNLHQKSFLKFASDLVKFIYSLSSLKDYFRNSEKRVFSPHWGIFCEFLNWSHSSKNSSTVLFLKNLAGTSSGIFPKSFTWFSSEFQSKISPEFIQWFIWTALPEIPLGMNGKIPPGIFPQILPEIPPKFPLRQLSSTLCAFQQQNGLELIENHYNYKQTCVQTEA